MGISPRAKPNSGMTITEVVVALAVIALVSALLLSCFSSAMAMIRRGADRQAGSDVAYADVQRGSAPSAVGSVMLVIEDKSYAIPGRFVSAEAGGVEYGLFVPD